MYGSCHFFYFSENNMKKFESYSFFNRFGQSVFSSLNYGVKAGQLVYSSLLIIGPSITYLKYSWQYGQHIIQYVELTLQA